MKEKMLYWLPRILGILAILFISIFALDAFEPGLTVLQQVRNFALHLIPSFILAIILFVAWRREFIGGLLLLLIGIAFTPFIYLHNLRMNNSVWISIIVVLAITFPFMLTGLLFILHHRLKNKAHPIQ